MSGTRPIPISNRGRASPPNSSSSRGGSPSLNDLHGISQSCPVVHNGNGHVGNGGNASGSYARFQPPRAPRFGSLPEPSFLQIDENPMPELLLPPPVQTSRINSPAAPSVVQFASSCPVDIGFLRQGNPLQHSWTPSPRALDEFDLSKSPALAVMSAAREGRAPMHNFRRVGQQQQQQTSPHNQLHRNRSSTPSSARQAYPENGLYTELMENLTITEEEQSFSDDSADFNHQSHSSQSQSYSSRRHDQSQQQQPQSSQYDRRERRGSYGSLSDNGDGGVFYFEES